MAIGFVVVDCIIAEPMVSLIVSVLFVFFKISQCILEEELKLAAGLVQSPNILMQIG